MHIHFLPCKGKENLVKVGTCTLNAMHMTHIFTSCTHIYTHPIFSTRINGHMLRLYRQTHTHTDTHTMKNINLQRYIYTQYYTQLTLTMCTNMNLQGYMYTHHTYTSHIGIHTPYTPTNTHTHTHTHTRTHTQTQEHAQINTETRNTNTHKHIQENTYRNSYIYV